jgi:hypothetical protein
LAPIACGRALDRRGWIIFFASSSSDTWPTIAALGVVTAVLGDGIASAALAQYQAEIDELD